MASTRPARGLGRGLVSLIDASAPAAGLAELPVDAVVPNPRQPRRRLDEGALADLTRSVVNDGVVQPIIVRDTGDGTYELIAGERRWRAARAAGLATVPAIIRVADERASLLLALVENVIREDLNAVEVARGYAALVDEFGFSAADVAGRVGKSRTTVVNTLRLLDLPDDVLALVADGTLSEGHGRAILQAESHDARREIARQAASKRLSVRQTEALARAATRARKRRVRAGPAWFDAELATDAVDAWHRGFGSNARVLPAAAGCTLVVSVSSHDQLVALVDRLEAVASLAETNIL